MGVTVRTSYRGLYQPVRGGVDEHIFRPTMNPAYRTKRWPLPRGFKVRSSAIAHRVERARTKCWSLQTLGRALAGTPVSCDRPSSLPASICFLPPTRRTFRALRQSIAHESHLKVAQERMRYFRKKFLADRRRGDAIKQRTAPQTSAFVFFSFWFSGVG